jgi:hypothetical protein
MLAEWMYTFYNSNRVYVLVDDYDAGILNLINLYLRSRVK